ncbi:MAG: hypothetical protein AAFP84_21455, partial [Actinomycetota bacterium]
MTLNRTRWAAIGAATAVTLGAGGLTVANADGHDANGVELFEPCRLLDTRDDFKVGDVDTLGEDSTTTIAATGEVGDCTIPETATGLSVNVIGIGGSEGTFLTFFPGGSELPNASHVNAFAGDVVSNGFDVALSETGELSIYNAFGDIDIVVDVLGAFVPGSAGVQGPAGEQGPAGPAGQQGPAG